MAENIADIAKISYVQKLQILQKLYLKNYKKLMRDKIPEIGKISYEELHAYRWELTSKTCECTKLKRISSHIKNVQMHENYKDFEPPLASS